MGIYTGPLLYQSLDYRHAIFRDKMSNPYQINWTALSAFPKEQVVCSECNHNYASRAKKIASQLLIAETPCPMCGELVMEDGGTETAVDNKE